MSLEADALVDRRRMSRKITFWRLAAIALAIVAILAFALSRGGRRGDLHLAPHVAKVSISGLITGDEETLKLLKAVQDSNTAEAVILSIESPGGTVSGSEVLYDGIRKLAAKKPVVSVVANTAASGAYIAAIGTDHIVSRGGAIVGSIGVIAQIPNATKLLGNIGIVMETVRSSPLKASPSGLEPTPPEARKALEDTVLDSFDWFRGLVKERRALSDEEIAKVADGRVFTGRQALPLKLVDEIGGETEALAWLQHEKNISDKLKVELWKKPDTSNPLKLMQSLGHAAAFVGWTEIAALLQDSATLAADAGMTGLLALWTPAQGR